MKRLLPAIALAMSILSSAVEAASPRLLIPVTFDAAAQVPDAVRDQCGIDYKVQEEAAHQLKGHDKSWEPTETLDGSVIRIAILDVKAGAAGGFTGAKSISARVQLLQDGKVQNSTVMHVSAYSVPILTVRGTCAILDKAARGLAKRVAEWARQPEKKFKDDDDAGGEPGTATQASEQASGVAH